LVVLALSLQWQTRLQLLSVRGVGDSVSRRWTVDALRVWRRWTDGTPFFDDPNQAHNQARTKAGGASGGGVVENESTPSREKDSKELKEFWKQYTSGKTSRDNLR
jgi:hypothetical protein